MIKYVAFLRGINVGGHKVVKMTDLARLFASLGLNNVSTYIASGNVVFEASETDANILIKRIEQEFNETFGFEVKVMLRTISEIQELIRLDPFQNVVVAPNVRLYVTFFAGELSSALELPYESPDGFQILQKTNREVFSVFLPTARTVDGTAFIEREFGKVSTTRNWNTVKRIAAL